MEKLERRYELDWLRVLAFGLLIFYHTGMIYVSWGFHIKSQETSNFLEIIMLAMNRWRLSLLFLISGAGVYFALQKRSNRSFAKERVKRLFFPLLFGMLVIVPPQIYFERLQKGATFSYLEFYPSVFEFVPYPKGGSLSWHHLWFVLYILVYSLVSIPIFNYLRSEKGKQIIDRVANTIFDKQIRIYLFIIGGFIISALLSPHFPTTHNLTKDWANLIGSWYAFLLGFVFVSHPKFMQVFENLRFKSLFWAVFCYSLLIFFRETGILKLHFGFGDEVRSFIYRIIDNGLSGFSIFAILGFARKHLNFNSPFLKEANKAVYPFYILHQTFIIGIGYYVLQLNWGIWTGLTFICIATFLSCLGTYWLVIRPFALTSFLFGVKKG
ncbi:MAG: acyltransferase family protein [Thermoflexibacter sp.]|nr:acyltransferase family protein [Thermoflexibacter sp.]